jgi:SpoVK/Ycf46/Vps4 family AAA+-type ATPase
MDSLKQLGDGKVAYVPFKSNYIKFEEIFHEQRDYQTGKLISKQFLYFRFYINLSTPMDFMGGDGFIFRIRKVQKNTLVPFYQLVPESFQKFYEKFIIELFKARESTDYSNVNKYRITEKEVHNINSEESNISRFTCISIIFPNFQGEGQEQFQKIREQLYSPDEDFLTSLTDFSSLPLSFDLQDQNKKKLSIGDARNKYNQIVLESGLDEDLCNLLNVAFSIENLLHINDPNSAFYKKIMKKSNPLRYFLEKEFKMGAILWGPPGTGKTYAIKKVFVYRVLKEIFNIGVVEIPASELAEGSKYYGALAEATTNIFSKGIRKVQETQRPCLIFVDEGDRLIENTNRDDDSQGVATLKNYLNPVTYPGLMLAINTNIVDEGDINTGISERRLDTIKFGYPSFDTNKKVWLEGIAEKIFYLEKDNKKKYSLNEIIFYQGDNRLDAIDVVNTLAKITSGIIGLDRIDDFCDKYRTLSRTSPHDPILDFNKFKFDFYIKTLDRVSQLEAEEIKKKAKSYGNNIDEQRKGEIEEKYNKIKEDLKNNFNQKSQEDLHLDMNSLILTLDRNDSSNGFYIHVEDLFKNLHFFYEFVSNDLRKLELNETLDITKKIYMNLSFITKYFDAAEHIINKEKFNIHFFTDLMDLFIKILVSKNDYSVLIDHIELAKKDSKPLTEKEQIFLFVNFKKAFLNLKIEELFSIKKKETKISSTSELDNSNEIKSQIKQALLNLMNQEKELERGFNQGDIPKNAITSSIKSLEFIKLNIDKLKKNKSIFNLFSNTTSDKIKLCDSSISLLNRWSLNPSIGEQRFNVIKQITKRLVQSIQKDLY